MADKERSILDTIKKRKIGFFGNMLRRTKYKLSIMMIQGKIEDGHSGLRRRKMS